MQYSSVIKNDETIIIIDVRNGRAPIAGLTAEPSPGRNFDFHYLSIQLPRGKLSPRCTIITVVILQGCIENHLVWHRMKEEYANLAGTKPSGCFIDNRSVNESWFSITFIYLHATSFLGCYTKSSRPDTNSSNTINWSKWQKCQSN